MKLYKLVRVSKTHKATYGVMLDEHDCPLVCTVEPPWVGNQVDISCVPEGLYRCHRTIRHKELEDACEVFMLEKVPGRTLIQIHIANMASQLLGCIAPVTFWTKFGREVGGGSSGIAFAKFMETLEEEDTFWLNITNSCHEFSDNIVNFGD